MLIVCLILVLVNHVIIDWEEPARNRAVSSMDQIVEMQYVDLVAWRDGKPTSNDFSKRTICRGRLKDWSDNRPFISRTQQDSINIYSNELGVFLVQELSDGACKYISSHQLEAKYSISNQFLTPGFSSLLDPEISAIDAKLGVNGYRDLFYFDVDAQPSKFIDAFLGIVFIIVFLIFYLRIARASLKHFALFTVLLLFLRYMSLHFELMQLLFRFPFFDPVNFTAYFVNPTLGDLFLNAVLLFIILIAAAKYFSDLRKLKWGLFAYSAFSTLLAGLVLHVAWTIVSNSQLSLDVGTEIHFDTLRALAFICILMVSLVYLFGTYHLLMLVRRSGKIYQTIAGVFVAATLLAAADLLAITICVVHVSIVLIAIRYRLGTSFNDFTYSNLLFILITAVGLSFVVSFIIYKYDEASSMDAKKKFANYLLLKRDVLGEYYLDQTIRNISEDEELEIIASERDRETLVTHLRNEFLSPYFNKYDLDIVFQDYQELRLNTRFTREYSLLDPENQSDFEDIYFVDEGASYKYVCKVNIGKLVALIILKVKRRVPTSVYPALITDNKYYTATTDFDYAVFQGDEVLVHRSKFGQGEWLSSEDISEEQLYESGIERNGKHYYGVSTEDGRTILIISKKYDSRDRLTNFSFFLLLYLLTFGFFSLFNSIRLYGVKLNFTSKIQLYLGLAFIGPLLLAGFALLNTLNTSYRDEINRTYLKQALYISEILSTELEEANQVVGAVRLSEISNFIQSDLSFYNEAGYLISTSQPEVFNLDLQGYLINPIVFEELVAKENQSIIADEKIGDLEYKVCYAVVNTVDNQVAGFIAMPFFDSKNHLRRQQIEVFSNLVIIFGFIFMLAIVFGNAVLNNLLYPLRMVAAKIRRVTLQEVNQPIQYESSDEIGSLVRDYNQMLVKLEDSKQALARSQKETAWKEIAKQVAHEIKNPLTPMQLKIQQMLRKHDKESKEFQTLQSLLTQVGTLSEIAESFSAFAEMPAPNNQAFDFSELTKQVVQLYQGEEADIFLKIEPQLVIHADPDIFRRILNNIVLNAIQSVEGRSPKLEISLVNKSEKAVLSVSDNGKGVGEDIRDKIFLNYFSTKSTGSGIGLALAKKGIENAGGNIWFESTQGEGSTFYISMPLASH